MKYITPEGNAFVVHAPLVVMLVDGQSIISSKAVLEYTIRNNAEKVNLVGLDGNAHNCGEIISAESAERFTGSTWGWVTKEVSAADIKAVLAEITVGSASVMMSRVLVPSSVQNFERSVRGINALCDLVGVFAAKKQKEHENVG